MPQGHHLRLSTTTAAAAAAMVVEHALTQTLPESMYHFGIHVIGKGGVVQDAEDAVLGCLVSNLWMGE